MTAARYSWGADEHLVVQVSEEMSLAANFTAMAMAQLLTSREISGVIDICPSNASLLVRFDPDAIGPSAVERVVRLIEKEVAELGLIKRCKPESSRSPSGTTIRSRTRPAAGFGTGISGQRAMIWNLPHLRMA